MINIKEVAKLANTSITTVSRVINNSGYVKMETRKRIEETIKTLGYKPLERSGGAKATKTFGLIVPNIENPFYGKMANYLSSVANSFNYNLLLINIKYIDENKDEVLMDLLNNRVNGLIYASSYRSLEIAHLAQDKDIPVVVLDREITTDKITSVSVNNNYGAFIATEHLIKLGHKNIAYIGASKNMEISTKRKTGYLRALEANHISVDERQICYGNYTMQSGFECAEMLLKDNQEITAVLAVNDLMAIGVINYLHKSGRKVPEDVSVLGFDNIELAGSITPSLTTVEYPIERMSEVVIELLLRQISDRGNSVEALTLFPKLVVRESTGPVKR
ncbi:LacI family DNA-binding transcriptional regulator [Desulfosporosinus sp.]|uniref:LacI family DNA-binding transcriptional regulator n=1 Tax=Desulfosporosinus sp. TaxID=157907 RepID=UPI00230A7387|nr:LacI family DNA-binding transcriptional regulator [Desulfosporosinus sp.]MCO5385199.1 LacI family transcriptional regulator [Desulfosporosinus sp.]MDA8222938.1 LacI family DNA-binding transcriptional regulator [Desulfitobacterium hafniense]